MEKFLVVLCVLAIGCTPKEEACVPNYFECMEKCGNAIECEEGCLTVFNDCVDREFVFDIHYVVVTPMASSLTESDLRAEVDTLNKYFRAFDTRFPDNRRKIVDFQYKSATLFSEVQGINSPMIDLLQSQTEDHIARADEFRELFNDEVNQLVRDSTAINIYIYDNFSSNINATTSLPWGLSSQTSHGRWNRNNPYNWIDYRRLGHRQAVEEHEMGHCFILEHVCNPGAVNSTPTNIMSSGNICGCSGAGGDRSIAFDADQVVLIFSLAPDIMDELGD